MLPVVQTTNINNTKWMTMEDMKENLEGGHNPGLLGLEPIKLYSLVKEGTVPPTRIFGNN